LKGVFVVFDSVVMFEGTIYEGGYGLIARQVMRDPELTPTAKAIYSYICSFAASEGSSERTAFPSVDLQCTELGISKDTYYKHRSSLVKKGYLRIEKTRGENGKFDRNLYKILAVQAPVELPPEIETAPAEKPANTEFSPSPKKPATVPSPKNPSTVDLETKSNSLKNDDDDIKKNARARELLASPVYALVKTQLSQKGFTSKNIKAILNKLAAEGLSFHLKPAVVDLAINYYLEGSRRAVVSSVPSFFLAQIEKAISHSLLEKYSAEEKARIQEQEAARSAGRPVPFYNWLGE
jgi:hypothetical protein